MPRNDEHQHKGTSNRGFASMDQAKQRAIASKGGQSVPPEKRSFSQDPALAAQAGRKGGESVPPEGRSFSQNRELAAEAGRKGGQARGASTPGGIAKRRAAKSDASDEISAGKSGRRAPGGNSHRKDVLGQQSELPPRIATPPKPEAKMSFPSDESGDGHEDMSPTEDIEGDDLSQGSGKTVFGSNQHSHDVS